MHLWSHLRRNSWCSWNLPWKCMFFSYFPCVLYDSSLESSFLQVIRESVVNSRPRSPSGAKHHRKILHDNIQGKNLTQFCDCSSLWQWIQVLQSPLFVILQCGVYLWSSMKRLVVFSRSSLKMYVYQALSSIPSDSLFLQVICDSGNIHGTCEVEDRYGTQYCIICQYLIFRKCNSDFVFQMYY